MISSQVMRAVLEAGEPAVSFLTQKRGQIGILNNKGESVGISTIFL
jgi:hypothetical protein